MKSYIPYKGALLNPRRDRTFKAIFGGDSPEARLALKSFLEAIFEKEVGNIQLGPNELPGDDDVEKIPRFDITCTMDGERVNVEMQNIDTFLNYANRVEYYVAHLLNHYAPKGKKWTDMEKVYQVSVLNFLFHKDSKDSAITQYQMRSEDGKMLNSRQNIIILELPKILEKSDDIATLTPVERWCTFLKYADVPEKRDVITSLCKAEAGIMAATTVLSRESQDEIAWRLETARDMAERDYLDLVGGIEDRDAIIAQKNAELKQQAAEIARLKAQLAELQQ